MHHAFQTRFIRDLRDAFFVIDKDDKKNVSEVLALEGLTFEERLDSNPDWIFERVRRFIPEPHTLEQQIKNVVELYKDKIDANTGKVLLDEAALKDVDAVVDGVRKGYYSDPPNESLYYEIGSDFNTGLKRYRCIRGTNSVEGSVHQKLARKFAGYVTFYSKYDFKERRTKIDSTFDN